MADATSSSILALSSIVIAFESVLSGKTVGVRRRFKYSVQLAFAPFHATAA